MTGVFLGVVGDWWVLGALMCWTVIRMTNDWLVDDQPEGDSHE